MDEATDKINDDWATSTHDDSAIASASSDDYDEGTEQIRAEIEDTRAEMSQTINEIQERLSPENVMDQVKEKVREATVGKVERVMDRVGETIGEVTEPAREVMSRAGRTIKETGRSAGDAIWRNPIPVALIGLGLGILMVRRYRGGNGYDSDDTYRTSSRTGRRSLMGETDYEMGRTQTDLDQNRHTTTGTLRGTASNLAHRSSEAINNLSTKVTNTASTMSTRFGQVLRENPLAVGAVAIAAGTAVGLVLPTTRFESEYIGEASERVVDKAQEVAREAIDKVQDVAQQQMGSEQEPGG